jgi:thiol-disulfide isomerase/thioredoxin
VQSAWQNLEQEKNAAQKKFQQFTAEQGQSWAGKLVKNKPLWFATPKKPATEQQLQYHLQYWQGINTSDTSLLNSYLYPELIYNYISYYLNAEGMGEEQLTKKLQEAVDTVVLKFSGQPATKKFVLQYMTKGFQQLGQETVLQYMDEKYNRAEQCSAQGDSALQKRLSAYLALKPGASAPEISFSGFGKDDAGLKDIQSDTLIVAFWASWCNHCQQAMPKVNELAAGRQNLKVLAVSLDDNPGAYMEAAGKLGNMLHLCDYMKWNSKPAVNYHITATPTFFMLDKERRIIGKFASTEMLAAKLKS